MKDARTLELGKRLNLLREQFGRDQAASLEETYKLSGEEVEQNKTKEAKHVVVTQSAGKDREANKEDAEDQTGSENEEKGYPQRQPKERKENNKDNYEIKEEDDIDKKELSKKHEDKNFTAKPRVVEYKEEIHKVAENTKNTEDEVEEKINFEVHAEDEKKDVNSFPEKSEIKQTNNVKEENDFGGPNDDKSSYPLKGDQLDNQDKTGMESEKNNQTVVSRIGKEVFKRRKSHQDLNQSNFKGDEDANDINDMLDVPKYRLKDLAENVIDESNQSDMDASRLNDKRTAKKSKFKKLPLRTKSNLQNLDDGV